MSPLNEMNKAIIDEFRRNHGKVGGHWQGRTLLLLHTLGAKSGQERINPVATFQDGNRWVVIASKGGAPTHPDWYFNLCSHPDVTVEVGGQTLRMHAREAEEPERTRLYEKMVSINPGFAEYRQRTSRVIPVMVLEPIQ